MKRVLTFFAIIAMAMGISQSVKAQQQYDGYIDTLNNRLYYRVTDTATVVIVPPTEEWSKEEGESDYSWKNWKGYTQPSGFVLIPDSITTWNGLVHGTLPVVAIESRTFYNCTGITSVKIPETVKDIKEAAFESCTELVTVDMPNSVERLGNGVFNECAKLEVCHISEGLTRIPEYCFHNCSSLKKVVLNENIFEIRGYAFYGCTGIDSLLCMSKNYVWYNEWPYYAWQNVEPKYLYTASCHFPVCPSEVIVYGNDIDSLELNSGCNVRKMVIGSGVKKIKEQAFNIVDRIDTLIMLPKVAPTLDPRSFYSSSLDSIVVYTDCDAEYYKDWGFAFHSVFGNDIHFLYTWDGAYTLSLRSDNKDQGKTEYITSVNCDQEISFKAVPSLHYYHFVRWSDGSTDSVRTITLTQDSSLTAFFALNQHTVTIHSADSTMGSVTGSGVYDWGEEVEISATANRGHHFKSWSDGYKNAHRTITVTKDSSITAYFERNEYHAYTYVAHYSFYGTAEVDETNPFYHDTITFTATPAEGMEFVGWSYNGEIVSTENPFKVEVESDTTLGAEFTYAHTDAIAEAAFANAQIFGSEKSIVVKNAAGAMVEIYDATGKTVVKEQRLGTNKATFALPQRGMYIVRLGNTPKKILVR